MILEIVRQIRDACAENEIPEPDIYTEFGKYTVGESGAHFSQSLVRSSKMTMSGGIWLTIQL